MIEFAKADQINLNYSIDVNELENILKEEFDYQINETELEKYQEIKDLHSIFVPNTKTLLLSNKLDTDQRTFIFSKELAYAHLKYKERLYIFSWTQFDNFDQCFKQFLCFLFCRISAYSKK